MNEERNELNSPSGSEIRAIRCILELAEDDVIIAQSMQTVEQFRCLERSRVRIRKAITRLLSQNNLYDYGTTKHHNND
jgi:hypothetical protein